MEENKNVDKSNKINDPSELEYYWNEELADEDKSFNKTLNTLDAYYVIKTKCKKYLGNNPIDLAVEIMNIPAIRMHGAEHHYLTPAVLLTVFYNLTNRVASKDEALEDLEHYILKNAPQSCSLEAGTCGAAIGSSLFFKKYLSNYFPADKLKELSDYVREKSIKEIDQIKLSRCCKRDTYISIIETSKVIRNELSLDIELSEPKCTFSNRNKTCGMEACPFFNLGNLIG